MKVFHVITGLSDGGAEAVLYRLLRNNSGDSYHVISLSGSGKYGPMLEALGVAVTTLNMSPGHLSVRAFLRLVRLLRKEKPDIVQTWMYHADLLGGLAARTAGIRNIVWGIHHTTLESGKSKKTTIWIAKILARLSWWLPVKIIVCAQRAIDAHVAIGYDRSKMRFIPNGYDLTEFQPRQDLQDGFKASVDVSTTIPLIGSVGRFDPQKDHVNLLKALAILHKCGVAFQCVLVGSGLNQSNSKLYSWIAENDLTDKVRLLGRRADIPKVMNALDLHILPSSAEGFPNVVAEAMACGTLCVVTDVGDASYIVGDTGWVVPPRNAVALAAAIEKALSMLNSVSWSQRCIAARKRIAENFDIDRMTNSYIKLWQEVSGARH